MCALAALVAKNRERIRPGSAHKKLPSSRYALAN
jgi:hypothetical protein